MLNLIYREFRHLVIEMVLATDMSFHFTQLKTIKNITSNHITMTQQDVNIKLYDFRVFNDANEETSDQNEYSDNTEFTIQMFGYNENNESCSIIVKDFKPYFYVKVGDDWTQGKKSRFFQHIKERIGKFYKILVKITTYSLWLINF